MATHCAVEVDRVTHRYGRRVALDSVSFDVPRASIFALLGPNGGGKTTLFRILATLLESSEGTARVGGADVVRQRAAVRARIGVVFQSPSLDVKLSVAENMAHQGHLYGLSGRRLRARSAELLARFDLADRGADRVEVLSGGLRRRVELAKAMLHGPEVLLLDEPSAGLDPGGRAQLMDHLIALRDRDGVTSLITTHLMDEADRCDRLAVLDRGRLVALDCPAGLKASIRGDIVTVASGAPGVLAEKIAHRFAIKPEVVDRSIHLEWVGGHAFVPELIEAFPGEIESVTVGRPTLDDVFLHLTGHHLRDELEAGADG